MNIRQRILTMLTVIAATISISAVAEANGTLIRWYKMGEDEGGTNNSAVSGTTDSPVGTINGLSDVQTLDLSATNSPTYRTVSGRQDGGSGIGIEFSAASQQRLQGDSLNWPQESTLSDSNGGLYNLSGIADRGFQLWVRPASTANQTIVMDTNQHGLRIENGKFSMRYAGIDYADTTQNVVANSWYHVEVVRPSGVASGSRLYVNGVAVAISQTTSDYAADNVTPLTVGSNLTGDGEFFSGVVDDLRMFVLGANDGTPPFDYGAFTYPADNAFAASPISGIKGVPGDVSNNGSFGAEDKTAFISGWLNKKVLNGVQIGDLSTRAKGDLNLDGITNIQDLVLMQSALAGAGMGAITANELAGVPEPAAILLAFFATTPVAFRRRKIR